MEEERLGWDDGREGGTNKRRAHPRLNFLIAQSIRRSWQVRRGAADIMAACLFASERGRGELGGRSGEGGSHWQPLLRTEPRLLDREAGQPGTAGGLTGGVMEGGIKKKNVKKKKPRVRRAGRVPKSRLTTHFFILSP